MLVVPWPSPTKLLGVDARSFFCFLVNWGNELN